jgi:hypothetical protein
VRPLLRPPPRLSSSPVLPLSSLSTTPPAVTPSLSASSPMLRSPAMRSGSSVSLVLTPGTLVRGRRGLRLRRMRTRPRRNKHKVLHGRGAVGMMLLWNQNKNNVLFFSSTYVQHILREKKIGENGCVVHFVVFLFYIFFTFFFSCSKFQGSFFCCSLFLISGSHCEIGKNLWMAFRNSRACVRTIPLDSNYSCECTSI